MLPSQERRWVCLREVDMRHRLLTEGKRRLIRKKVEGERFVEGESDTHFWRGKEFFFKME